MARVNQNKGELHSHSAILSFCTLLSIIAIGFPVSVSAEQIPPVVITCLGDSVTHSYPYGDGFRNPGGIPDLQEDVAKTYPGQLANQLDNQYYPRKFEVYNKGINGETAGGLADKLDPAKPEFAHLLDDNPDFVLLMIGGNDLNGAGEENFGDVVEQTTTEAQECVNRIKEHTNPDGQHPRVILSAFIPNRLPDVDGWNPNIGIRTYNGQHWLFSPLLYDLSEVTNVDEYFYTNFWDLYDDQEERADINLMSPGDPIHPNEQGYGIIAQNWLDVLATFQEFTDSDNDGVSDADEALYGTNPQNADSDGDGLNDLWEITCGSAQAALDANERPPVKINFQPFGTTSPQGYLLDAGRSFNTGAGYGW